MKYLNTTQVAELLNVTPAMVCSLCNSGDIPATKVGRDWVISEVDAETAKNRPHQRRKGGGRKPKCK